MAALDPIYVEAGARLRELRLAEGRTQAEVAAAAGISASTLSNIERASKAASLDTLGRVGRALRGTPHFVVDAPSPPEEPSDAGLNVVSGGVIR